MFSLRATGATTPPVPPDPCEAAAVSLDETPLAQVLSFVGATHEDLRAVLATAGAYRRARSDATRAEIQSLFDEIVDREPIERVHLSWRNARNENDALIVLLGAVGFDYHHPLYATICALMSQILNESHAGN